MKLLIVMMLLLLFCCLGSIFMVSLVIVDVYFIISLVRIMIEIMVDDNLRIRWWICRRRRRILNKREIELKWKFGGMICEEERFFFVFLYRWKSFFFLLFVICIFCMCLIIYLVVFFNLLIIIICVLFF